MTNKLMSYTAWRITFQDSEQAAQAAYREVIRLTEELNKIHSVTCAHGISYFKPCTSCDGLNIDEGNIE